MGEVTRGLEVIEFACGIPHLLKGGMTEQASTGSTSTRSGSRSASSPGSRPSTSRRWCRCGCGRRRWPGGTRSFSSPEKDPSASIWTAELLKEAGLPDGVFNVVHGDKVAVDAILEHPDVAAVSFVGSTPDRPLHLRDRDETREARRRSAARRTT